jgi:hypothetical protein
MFNRIIKIKWNNRFKGDVGNRCLVCVDGIHIKINEPRPFSPKWNSHKLGGSALAYELVTNIMTGDIVAYNGPFHAGEWSDIKNFRHRTRRHLGPGEKVLADLGYQGDERIVTKVNSRNPLHSYGMGCARDRHETINGRLRHWGSLKQCYRHCRHTHNFVFRSVIVIEQIKMNLGEKPFQIVNYIDPVLLCPVSDNGTTATRIHN